MLKSIENYKGEVLSEVSVHYSQVFKSHGHWNIVAEVQIGKGACYVNGATKEFKKLVYAGFVDQISELKSEDSSYETIQEAYDDNCWDDIEESVIEWVEETLESFQEEN